MSDRIVQMIIESFQSHKKTVLDFHPGVNVIVGPNDTGKSAILRAFDANVLMSPMHLQTGAQEAKVFLAFEQGNVLRTRKESKSGKLEDQKYVLHRAGEEPEFWKKLGRALPPPLLEFINMGLVVLDDRTKFSLNVSRQHDPPFMISSSFSGATRIKMLGSMTDQHLFDEGARQLAKEKKQSDSSIKTFQGLLLEARDHLKVLEEEEDLSAIADLIYKTQTKLQEVRQERAELEGLSNRLRSLAAQRRELDVVLARLPDTAALQVLCDGHDAAALEADHLTSLFRRLRGGVRHLSALDATLRELPDLSRVGPLLATWEDIASGPEQDLLARLDDATRKHDELARSDWGETLQAAQARLAELDTCRGETERDELLLHRFRDLRKQSQLLDLDEASAEEDLVHARGELETAVKEAGHCPFWDEVELQPACAERLAV